MKSVSLILVFLVLFSSAIFSSKIWTYSTDGSVLAPPIIYHGALAVVSDDGNVYALNYATGALEWKTFVGLTPNEMTIFGTSLIVSTTAGTVSELSQTGQIVWTVNLNQTQGVQYIYGTAADSHFIFVTTDNGVYSIDSTGNVRLKLYSYDNGTPTPPTAVSDGVIFGIGNELVYVHETGSVAWTSPISSNNFWLARPVVNGDSIYIGALDGQLHEFSVSTGAQGWEYPTGNWILGDALFTGGIVYVGSDNGGLYALDNSGNLLWQANTSLGIETQPEAGVMAGEPVIFVGDNDGNVYAIDQSSGKIDWTASADDMAGSPLFYNNEVIFGSADHNVYAYSTERACSISGPSSADPREVEVQGSVISQYSDPSVSISINGGAWQPAEVNGSSWNAFIDPATSFVTGLNTVSCMVTDSNGAENGDSFPTISLTYDPTLPEGTIVSRLTQNIMQNTPFTLFVSDGADGSSLQHFNVTIAGKTYQTSNNLTLSLPAGTYVANITKVGYNTASIEVTVSSSGLSIFDMIVILVIIIGLAYLLWTQILKKKAATAT